MKYVTVHELAPCALQGDIFFSVFSICKKNLSTTSIYLCSKKNFESCDSWSALTLMSSPLQSSSAPIPEFYCKGVSHPMLRCQDINPKVYWQPHESCRLLHNLIFTPSSSSNIFAQNTMPYWMPSGAKQMPSGTLDRVVSKLRSSPTKTHYLLKCCHSLYP